MPTINQLIRKARKSKSKKTKAPALQSTWNTIKNRATKLPCPQKRGVCVKVTTMTPKNQILRYVKLHVYVLQMEWK